MESENQLDSLAQFLGKIFFNEEINKPKVMGVIEHQLGVYFIV